MSSYYWPPGQSCLRIIDTPGIEGFKGDDLATMALDFVDQADHILFLLSDDKASSGELDHLGRIRTLGKAVTVLLNVKKKDLDLLIEAPDLVFDAKALKEHSERIAAYLTQHYDIEDARVIPFHAGAAWASTQEEERERMAALRRASRIEDVEARLRGFAAKEARGARLRSPRDLLLSFIVNVKTELRPFAGVFRRWPAEFEGRFKSLDGPLKEIHARGVSRLKSIAAPTAEAASRVPALVDSLIAARKGGKRLASEWKGLLEETGVTTATTRFAEETRKDFEDELREQARVGRFDGALRPDEGADLGDVFSKVERMQEDENVKRYARAGGRAAGGAGAAALAGWAVANWWNPTGWVAALAVAGVGLVGWAGERAAKAATDSWKESDERELRQERDAIIARLQKRLWDDHGARQAKARAWLDSLTGGFRTRMSGTVRTVGAVCERLLHATQLVLRQLDDMRSQMDRAFMEHALRFVSAEVANGKVIVARTAWEPGRVKILARKAESGRGSAVGALIGVGGSRIHVLREVLGESMITVVDGDAPLPDQVAAALYPARVDPGQVEECGSRHFQVKLRGSQGRLARGSHGANVQAAERLLGLKTIRILTEERREEP